MLDTVLEWMQKLAPYWPFIQSIFLAIGLSIGSTSIAKGAWRAYKEAVGLVLSKRDAALETLFIQAFAILVSFLVILDTWPAEYAVYWAFFFAFASPLTYVGVIKLFKKYLPWAARILSSTSSVELKMQNGLLGIKLDEETPTVFIDPKTGKVRE